MRTDPIRAQIGTLNFKCYNFYQHAFLYIFNTLFELKYIFLKGNTRKKVLLDYLK